MKRLVTGVAIFIAILVLLALGTALVRVLSGQPLIHRYVLPTGTTHQGDLTIAAHDVELQPESAVEGNVSIAATGSVRVAGRIEGRLAILAPASAVELDRELVVTGDLAICARALSPLDDLSISGRRHTGCDQLGMILNGTYSQAVGIGAAFPPVQLPFFSRYTGTFGERLFQIITTAFAVAALAALSAVLFPARLRRMNAAAAGAPRTAALVGFMSMSAALGLTLLYGVLAVVTLGVLLVALPVVALAWVVIAAALVAGWIAVSYSLGRLLMWRMRTHWPPMVTAAVGAGSLTLLQGLLEMLPCLGWLGGLLILIVGSVGLGALLLTRLGARAYPEYIRYDLR